MLIDLLFEICRYVGVFISLFNSFEFLKLRVIVIVFVFVFLEIRFVFYLFFFSLFIVSLYFCWFV